MRLKRVFMDTFYVEALLNRRDAYHRRAAQMLPDVRAAAEVWTTEAVLVEVGNALPRLNRADPVQFIRQCYAAKNVRVVNVDPSLFTAALEMYAAGADKDWGLTDCISFVVMAEQGITDALTGDEHFRQAGHRPLLARDS